MPTTQSPHAASAPDWRALLSSRLVIALGALLVLQLLLALVLDLRSINLSPAASQGPLLSFDQAKVTRIRIESPGKDALVIEKTPKGWHIPSLWDFPAADFRVTDLLTKLAALQKHLPVATSEAASKRFKVADDTFERRLTIEGDKGPLATLYLGDSPGFRRLFVRADGDKAIYEAELALFDASDKPDDWSDKNALHLKEKDVQRVELPGIVLARGDKGAWKLGDLAAGETLNGKAVEDAVRKVSTLDFLSVLGKGDKPEYKQQTPALEYKVQLATDETLTYRISKPEKGDDYVLKASNSPYYFSVSKYTLDGLTDIKHAGLVEGNEKKATIPSAAPAAGTTGRAQTTPSPSRATEAPKPTPPVVQAPAAKTPSAAGPQVPAVQPPSQRRQCGKPTRSGCQIPQASTPSAEAPPASAVPAPPAKPPAAESPQAAAPVQAPPAGTSVPMGAGDPKGGSAAESPRPGDAMEDVKPRAPTANASTDAQPAPSASPGGQQPPAQGAPAARDVASPSSSAAGASGE